MYQQIHEYILSHQVIIIHRHINPDGDAIGSQLGLKEILKITFPDKLIFAVGDASSKYEFLGKMDDVPKDLFFNALVIVLDSSDTKLISDERYQLAKTIIKIDHHVPVTNYGHINLVDTNEISCASLIAKITQKLKYQWNKEAARALFVGIVSDSNRFYYNGVNSQTFHIASLLTKFPFSLDEVYEKMYLQPLKFARLRASFVLKFQLTHHNVAYHMTPMSEWKNYGVDLQTISRGMVNTMSGIEGIYIWVNFTEDDDKKVIAEIRSNRFNINVVAQKYGGGGHPFASGAYLNSFEEAAQMLQDLDQIMEEKNESKKG
ncbi:MAG: bifunctional oligoribonuclease/PAP phosphatase NrnA [Bacilli bacterium]